MHIFLLGFMGTGKSHWGKAVAHEKGLAFFDLDTLIEEKEGKTIAQIFTQEGEDSFRKKEADSLRSLSSHPQGMMVSTGGGTPCFYDNMTWMNQHGVTIFLQASPEFVVRNIAKEKAHRPLITHLSDRELLIFTDKKMHERLPFYSRAQYTLNAETVTIDTITEILDQNI
jgi:shikimate kinase